LSEIKSYNATQFVGFPLIVPVRLLDDQNVAQVSCKTWRSVAIDINGGSGVEQSWISIGHIASRVSVKFFSSNAKSVFLPL
jgi:hypothetical protein